MLLIEKNQIELDKTAFQAALLQAGAILLRHPSHTLADFLAVSERLTDQFLQVDPQKGAMGAIGANFGRKPIAGSNSLFSATGGDYALPLHGEGYFHFSDPPHLLWFFCANPAQEAGETLLCDGEKLFASLPQTIQAGLLQQDIVYSRIHPPSTWQELYGSKDPTQVQAHFKQRGIESRYLPDGSIESRFRSCAIRHRAGKQIFVNNLLPFALRELETPEQTQARVRFANAEPIPSEWVFQIQAQAQAQQEEIHWQAMDILVIDNTRFLHGRRQIRDPQRELYLRLGYANFIRQAVA